MSLPPLLNPDKLVPNTVNPMPLRYPSDYHRAMVVLGRKEWPTLKKRLSSPDAAIVVVALNAYIGAILTNKSAIEAHDAFDSRIWPNTRDMNVLQERWDEMNRLRREARYAMRVQSIKRYDLMALLVGKENLCVERPNTDDSDYDDSGDEYDSE